MHRGQRENMKGKMNWFSYNLSQPLEATLRWCLHWRIYVDDRASRLESWGCCLRTAVVWFSSWNSLLMSLLPSTSLTRRQQELQLFSPWMRGSEMKVQQPQEHGGVSWKSRQTVPHFLRRLPKSHTGFWGSATFEDQYPLRIPMINSRDLAKWL